MKSVIEDLKENGFEKRNYNLGVAFDDALKDPDFKKLALDLKIDKKILMKYTTILEQSKVEYKHCQDCKSLLECKNKVDGYCYLPRLEDNGLVFEYKKCKYKEALDKDLEYRKNTYYCDEPEAIRNADIKDIFMNDKNRFEAIEWIHKFIKTYPKNTKQKGLYLNGNFGCGKTYLISAMFNELAKKGYKSAVIFWPQFLVDLKASFQNDFRDKFEFVKRVPLLLIDDIGAENTTEWSRDDIFCPLVQYRMDNNLPTFFTSNLTLEELEEHFTISKNEINPVKSRRIIERIKQLTVDLKMISKNLRK